MKLFKNMHWPFIFGFLFFLSACDGDESVTGEDKDSARTEGHFSLSDGGSSSGGSGGGSDNGNGNDNEDYAGLVTAGEWNDLENWTFWESLLNGQDYSEIPEYWQFYTNNRVAFLVNGVGGSLVNAKVEISKGGTVVGATRTDNLGRADIWLGLHQKETVTDLSAYSLKINGTVQTVNLKRFVEGVNEVTLSSSPENLSRVELAFIVDATGRWATSWSF